MYRLAALSLAACGAAPPPEPAPPAPPPVAPRAPIADDDATPAIDPLVALTDDSGPLSWVIPGRISLALGDTPIDAPDGAVPIATNVIDRSGESVRVTIIGDHVRYAVWTDRSNLLAATLKEVQLAGGFDKAKPYVQLASGVAVKRLAEERGRVKIRYSGAIEVEGWVDETLLGERALHHVLRRLPMPMKQHHVFPGSVIREATQWTAPAIGVVAGTYQLDLVREVDETWLEVGYKDSDLQLRGYLSRREPPGRTHKPRGGALLAIQSNQQIAAKTCLYDRDHGEPIGFATAVVDARVEPAGAGWWSVMLDTPWGPIGFAARGDLASELAPCPSDP